MQGIDISAGADYFANPHDQPRPHVRFEMRATEVRDEQGLPQMKDVAWVKVTAAGGKDSLEKPVEDWLRDQRAHAKNGRVPQQWPDQYASAFEAWKKGQEIPVDGFPIKIWSVPSPAQRENILLVGIQTVEDLAKANDEALGRIGMGGVLLRTAARNWLEERTGAGALTNKLAAAETKMAELAARNVELEKQIATLRDSLPKK